MDLSRLPQLVALLEPAPLNSCHCPLPSDQHCLSASLAQLPERAVIELPEELVPQLA
jgi:hypothetical protein